MQLNEEGLTEGKKQSLNACVVGIEEADLYVPMWKKLPKACVSRILDVCAGVYMCWCDHMHAHTCAHAAHRCPLLFTCSLLNVHYNLYTVLTQNAPPRSHAHLLWGTPAESAPAHRLQGRAACPALPRGKSLYSKPDVLPVLILPEP